VLETQANRTEKAPVITAAQPQAHSRCRSVAGFSLDTSQQSLHKQGILVIDTQADAGTEKVGPRPHWRDVIVWATPEISHAEVWDGKGSVDPESTRVVVADVGDQKQIAMDIRGYAPVPVEYIVGSGEAPNLATISR